jgi:hypothetical protein
MSGACGKVVLKNGCSVDKWITRCGFVDKCLAPPPLDRAIMLLVENRWMAVDDTHPDGEVAQ